jgi:hypothetical protein
MIPEGYYKARAVKRNEAWAQFGRAKTGTEQILMMFRVIDGSHEGVELPWFGSFTENTWERTLEGLRYCGFRGDDLTTLNAQKLDDEVSIKVEHQTNANSGKTYARVAFVNAEGGGVQLSEPMDGNQLRNFAAMMQAKIRGSQGGISALAGRFDDAPHPSAEDPLDGLPSGSSSTGRYDDGVPF